MKHTLLAATIVLLCAGWPTPPQDCSKHSASKNSLLIANQIPFSCLAYFRGGHSFLYTEPKHFADTVSAFLQ